MSAAVIANVLFDPIQTGDLCGRGTSVQIEVLWVVNSSAKPRLDPRVRSPRPTSALFDALSLPVVTGLAACDAAAQQLLSTS